MTQMEMPPAVADPAVSTEEHPLGDRPTPLTRTEAHRVATLLKAVADPVRLQLIAFLMAQEGEPVSVGHLTQAVDLSQPTVSHHLKLMAAAGLVNRERRGASVRYSLVPDRLRDILAELSFPTA